MAAFTVSPQHPHTVWWKCFSVRHYSQGTQLGPGSRWALMEVVQKANAIPVNACYYHPAPTSQATSSSERHAPNIWGPWLEQVFWMPRSTWELCWDLSLKANDRRKRNWRLTDITNSPGLLKYFGLGFCSNQALRAQSSRGTPGFQPKMSEITAEQDKVERNKNGLELTKWWSITESQELYPATLGTTEITNIFGKNSFLFKRLFRHLRLWYNYTISPSLSFLQTLQIYILSLF